MGSRTVALLAPARWLWEVVCFRGFCRRPSALEGGCEHQAAGLGPLGWVRLGRWSRSLRDDGAGVSSRKRVMCRMVGCTGARAGGGTWGFLLTFGVLRAGFAGVPLRDLRAGF